MKNDMGTLEYLIEDVGGPQTAARLCGVHYTTVYRWLRMATPLPKTAYRTLYHASKWGRGEREVWSVNMSRITGQLIETLRADLRARDAEIARLLTLADFGCANAPLFRLVGG